MKTSVEPQSPERARDGMQHQPPVVAPTMQSEDIQPLTSDSTGAETNSSSSDHTPITAHSVEQLAKVIRQRMHDHPYEKLPGLLRLNKSHLDSPPTQAIMTSTSEQVLIFRYQVTAQHMAWFLLLGNGSCMLVSPRKSSPCGYVAWLGTNLGFTSNVIAYKVSARPTKPRVDCVKNMDGSKGDSGWGNEKSDLVGNIEGKEQHSLSSAFDDTSDEDLTSAFDDRSDEDFQPGIPIVLSYPPSRRESMQKERLKRGKDEKLSKEPTKPLPPHQSSQDIQRPLHSNAHRQIERLVLRPSQPRLEPESVSNPAFDPQSSLSEHYGSQSRRSLEIQTTVRPVSSPSLKRERPLSLEMLDQAPGPSLPRSKRTKNERASCLHPSTTTPYGTQSASSQLATPPRTLGMPTPSSQSESALGGAVIFQFLLADESNGAVPKLLHQCNTMASFFDSASAAWGALGGAAQKAEMAVVTVSVPGVARPIVVPWRDTEVFDTMFDAVMKASRQMKSLEVEVRCKQTGEQG